MGARLAVERAELRRKLAANAPSNRPPPVTSSSEEQERTTQFDQAMRRMMDLRELLRTASSQLSELHAEELSLNAKRARVLGDTCAILSRAVGESGGTVPPPLPSTALEEKPVFRPVVDIPAVADPIHSPRPTPPQWRARGHRDLSPPFFPCAQILLYWEFKQQYPA